MARAWYETPCRSILRLGVTSSPSALTSLTFTVPHTTDQDPAEINLNVLTETNKLPKVGGARAVPKGAKSGLFSGESTEPSPRRGNMTVKEEKRVCLACAWWLLTSVTSHHGGGTACYR